MGRVTAWSCARDEPHRPAVRPGWGTYALQLCGAPERALSQARNQTQPAVQGSWVTLPGQPWEGTWVSLLSPAARKQQTPLECLRGSESGRGQGLGPPHWPGGRRTRGGAQCSRKRWCRMSPSNMSSSRLRTTMCSGSSSALIHSISTCRPRGTAVHPAPHLALRPLNLGMLPAHLPTPAQVKATSSRQPSTLSRPPLGSTMDLGTERLPSALRTVSGRRGLPVSHPSPHPTVLQAGSSRGRSSPKLTSSRGIKPQVLCPGSELPEVLSTLPPRGAPQAAAPTVSPAPSLPRVGGSLPPRLTALLPVLVPRDRHLPTHLCASTSLSRDQLLEGPKLGGHASTLPGFPDGTSLGLLCVPVPDTCV